MGVQVATAQSCPRWKVVGIWVIPTYHDVGEQAMVVWFSVEVEDRFFSCFFGCTRWHEGSIFSETKKVIIALKQGRTGRTSAAQGQRQGCESTVLEKGPFARETEDAEFYISRHRRPQLGEGGHESS